jgi:PEP-CTERM motif
MKKALFELSLIARRLAGFPAYAWEENSSAQGIFSTDGGGAFPIPSIEIASRAAAPEPSVWAMMILGFAGCGFAALRRRRHEAKLRPAL